MLGRGGRHCETETEKLGNWQCLLCVTMSSLLGSRCPSPGRNWLLHRMQTTVLRSIVPGCVSCWDLNSLSQHHDIKYDIRKCHVEFNSRRRSELVSRRATQILPLHSSLSWPHLRFSEALRTENWIWIWKLRLNETKNVDKSYKNLFYLFWKFWGPPVCAPIHQCLSSASRCESFFDKTQWWLLRAICHVRW